MNTVRKLMTGCTLALTVAACGGSAGSLTSSTTPPLETGGGSTSQARSGLVGDWQLVTLTETGHASMAVSEPQRFTASFRSDGLVSLRADCNRCTGGYTATRGTLAVGPMACTRAYCSSAPLDTTFASLVQGATTWTATDGRLELRSDAGVLGLRR